MAVRNKYGGYWNKTRSMTDSGGLSVPCMISTTKVFPLTGRLITRQASPCHTGHSRPDEVLGTSSCLPKTTTFPASFRYAREAYKDEYPHQYIHSSRQGKLHYALMHVTLSLHKNNIYSKSKWCCNRIKQHTKILCPGSECLPSRVCKWGCTF